MGYNSDVSNSKILTWIKNFVSQKKANKNKLKSPSSNIVVDAFTTIGFDYDYVCPSETTSQISNSVEKL